MRNSRMFQGARSTFFISSLTSFGLALPHVAFMTWPMRKLKVPSLPFRYSATGSDLARRPGQSPPLPGTLKRVSPQGGAILAKSAPRVKSAAFLDIASAAMRQSTVEVGTPFLAQAVAIRAAVR